MNSIRVSERLFDGRKMCVIGGIPVLTPFQAAEDEPAFWVEIDAAAKLFNDGEAVVVKIGTGMKRFRTRLRLTLRSWEFRGFSAHVSGKGLEARAIHKADSALRELHG